MGKKRPTVIALRNDQEVNALYESWAGFLERKPYPRPEAVANVLYG